MKQSACVNTAGKLKKNPVTQVSILIFILFIPAFCRCQDLNNNNTSRDSIYLNHSRNISIKSFIIPATLIAAGSFMAVNDQVVNRFEIMEERNKRYGTFRHNADDYLQIAPLLIAGVIEVADHSSKSVLKKRFINLVKTELVVSVLSYSIKSLTMVRRPDSESLTSFPSGHTAEAFALATFLYN